jgi:PAS domain S-box-containing protein
VDIFRDLAEKSLAGIYLIQDHAFRYVNPRFAEIFHYAPDDLIGRHPEEIVLSEDWPMVERNMRRIAGGPESVHYQYRGVTKDGQIVEVEVYGSSTLYQGRPAVTGTLLDVTERRHAEEMLRKAEEEYRGLFENAVEAIFRITPEGRFIMVNRALARMMGYGSPEELIAAQDYVERGCFVDPDRRSEFMRVLRRDGIVLGFQSEVFTKDGAGIWASMQARALRDAAGAILYYEGTIQDVTEQKRAEDELLRLNEFNRAIIGNAPVAIFTLDGSGVFTSINPALEALSGLGTKAERKLIGFNWLKNSYTVKSGLAAYIERGLRGEPFQLWDFPFMTYSGDRNLFMDFKGVPLKAKDGAIEGLLCIIEETTDRVKTRARLMQEAHMSAIGKLAAGIAHELNNPLATLVAHSELASNCLKSFEKSPRKRAILEELRGYLTIIEAQAFRCKNVTADILNLPWKEGLEISRIDVNNLLDNILDVADTGKSDLRIVREFSGLPTVRANASAIRQIFWNLISNALDAVEGRMDAIIRIKTGFFQNRVMITVEDNGIGIPAPILEKIFEPFFTTKESKKGVGLGLSLCHEFLSHMGGTVRAESKPGRGASFVVSLPAELSGKEGND